MNTKELKIIYFISRWYEGTAYKNINFMKDNFGGEIVKDNEARILGIIKQGKPDLMVVRGDTRDDYRIALKRGIPYILIENDVNSMRRKYIKEILEHEKAKIENASAVIFTSKEHAEYYKKLEKEQGWKIPYYQVIYTRPLKKDLDFEPKEKLSGMHLVYAGGTLPQWRRKRGHYGYRCYHEIFEAFIKAGWKIHLYSASYNNGKLSEYKNIGCRIHENLSYKHLLREMSQYTAGLHAYNKTGVEEKAFGYTQTCRGNKIWDYLAAGIPTIGYNGGKGMDIYKGKWGVIIDDLKGSTLKKIPGRLAKLKITGRMRKSNVMDKDLKKYENVIREAIQEGKKGIDTGPAPYIPYKNENGEPFPKMIEVTNKGPREIVRANRIFKPYSTTEAFLVNQRAWKEIKAHVGLRIRHMD